MKIRKRKQIREGLDIAYGLIKEGLSEPVAVINHLGYTHATKLWNIQEYVINTDNVCTNLRINLNNFVK